MKSGRSSGPCSIGEASGICRGELRVPRPPRAAGAGADLGAGRGGRMGVPDSRGALAPPVGWRRGHLADAHGFAPRPQLERARSETEEALSALRRLQRRVSELEEESRLQDADLSGASLQLELAHSLDSDQDQNQNADRSGDPLVSFRPTRLHTHHSGGLQTPPLIFYP